MPPANVVKMPISSGQWPGLPSGPVVAPVVDVVADVPEAAPHRDEQADHREHHRQRRPAGHAEDPAGRRARALEHPRAARAVGVHERDAPRACRRSRRRRARPAGRWAPRRRRAPRAITPASRRYSLGSKRRVRCQRPPGEARPPDAVAAVRVEVPAGAAALVPDAVAQPLVGLAVELLVDLGADLDASEPAPVHLLDRGERVVHVRLGGEDDRVVAAGAVRARRAGRGWGSRRSSVPRYARGLPCQASPSVRPPRPRTRAKAGLSWTLKPVPRMIVSISRSAAVGGHDRARAHLADRVGHDLGVRRGERGVVAVRHRDPLAAERVVRRELAPQLRVGDLAARWRRPIASNLEDRRRFDDRAEHRGLVREVEAGAQQPLRGRHALEEPALEPVTRRSGSGRTQDGVRWKRWRLPTCGWIVGARTGSRRRPVPITATRSPLRSWSWSQRGGVEASCPRSCRGPGCRAARARSGRPSPPTSTSALSGPCEVSSRQRWASSSHAAPVTSWPKRMYGITPKSSAQRRR